MNESFSDLTIFDNLEVSQDPTPFLHSLSENTIKGWMYSPVTGGGTASVEFEYLTGFSTIFQPPPHGSLPALHQRGDAIPGIPVWGERL